MDRKPWIIALSLLVIPALGVVDQATGDDLSLVAFYFLPIVASTWYGGVRWGIAAGAAGIGAWALANIAFPFHMEMDGTFFRGWELVEKLVFFAAVIVLVSRLADSIRAERRRALSDFATGLPNRRAFMRDLGAVLARGEAVCVAYFEIEGLEELYLDRGEAFVEALFKDMASQVAALPRGYRVRDERFAAIIPGASGTMATERMGAAAERLKDRVLEPKGLKLEFKIGVAVCSDCRPEAGNKLLRFLEGSMVFLHGKPGTQIDAFEFR